MEKAKMAVNHRARVFGAAYQCPAGERTDKCCYNFLPKEDVKILWENVNKLSEEERIRLDNECKNCCSNRVLKNSQYSEKEAP